MILKDGTDTDDVRLDRLKQFDEQSRRYGVADVKVVVGKKPRSYTWRLDSHLDQGQEGACVGFAWAQELLARPSEVRGVTDDFARTRVYWEAQKIDPWAGGAYPGASPFYEGTSILAGAKIIKSLGAIQEYRWAFTHEEMVLGVGYTGPGILGCDWHVGMMETDSDGFIHPTGSVVGGHAILVRGVSLKKGYFLLHNSWGPTWGQNGTCKVSFDSMMHLRANWGEVCFPVGRKRITV